MTRPCALAIAGLDPSGGAGIAADLRAFSRAGAWGCAVVSVLTVQSTAGLRAVHSVPTSTLEAQAEELFAHQNIVCVKTGALGSAANTRAVLALARRHPNVPFIVDPVRVATRGRAGVTLLDDTALEAMRELAASAFLVTPNADEAASLLGRPVRSRRDQRSAAADLVERGARAALVKGGHLRGREAVDVLATRERIVELRAPRIRALPFHGGGCSLASLIAGRLASKAGRSDREIVSHVRWAKATLGRAIARSSDIGDGLRILWL